MTVLALGVAFLRVGLAIITIEASWRFWRWWRQVRHNHATENTRYLVLGLFLIEVGLFGAAISTVFAATPRTWVALGRLLWVDSFLIAGSFVALYPNWRLSGMMPARVRVNVIARLIAAVVIGALLIAWDLQ